MKLNTIKGNKQQSVTTLLIIDNEIYSPAFVPNDLINFLDQWESLEGPVWDVSAQYNPQLDGN